MPENGEPLNPLLLRKRSGLTQRQVAETLGKRVTTISDWERGATQPRLSLSEVKALMTLYQCSLDELIEAFETDRA
ncbi:MAG: helix-turn-helix transcriptional regulator [Leptolyngbyaceae cyanobacterium SM1_1_3]|nr:helix-turn-helix transcriptional regulator [Leptolyngbyaceae cyanobacterium SM1_1_3]NJM85087.1 helix-turn-helix transcriptional regulator [Leptolyngbyaceae cyanobacterium RM2_2_21]NJN02443.1 helix-turn-helix transcriptional regulator [Leptolyngbyaceae cyanobacterium RM1_1_2]NJO10466.1 helix-turn-helix transcriptional regulator [Leptolyngbyaceae cyanobacterium SL_1_1]